LLIIPVHSLLVEIWRTTTVDFICGVMFLGLQLLNERLDDDRLSDELSPFFAFGLRGFE